jgi:hypothetical protein
MRGFAYRFAYRVGKRITNGRLYGTPLYRGVRGFLRRRLVADVIETNGYKLAIDPYDSCFDPRIAFAADEPAWEPQIVELMSPATLWSTSARKTATTLACCPGS